MIDYYALRSQQPRVVLQLLDDNRLTEHCLSVQPNFCFAKALAMFQLSKNDASIDCDKGL
jgi:hypothetical protein